MSSDRRPKRPWLFFTWKKQTRKMPLWPRIMSKGSKYWFFDFVIDLSKWKLSEICGNENFRFPILFCAIGYANYGSTSVLPAFFRHDMRKNLTLSSLLYLFCWPWTSALWLECPCLHRSNFPQILLMSFLFLLSVYSGNLNKMSLTALMLKLCAMVKSFDACWNF